MPIFLAKVLTNQTFLFADALNNADEFINFIEGYNDTTFPVQ